MGNYQPVNTGMDVIVPEKKPALPVIVEDWNDLKRSVVNMREDQNLFYIFGSIFVGCGLPTVFQAFTGNVSPTDTIPLSAMVAIFYIAGGASLVVGIALFGMGKNRRSDLEVRKAELLRAMRSIERHCLNELGESSPPVAGRVNPEVQARSAAVTLLEMLKRNSRRPNLKTDIEDP